MKKFNLFLFSILLYFVVINVEALSLVNEEVDIYALDSRHSEKISIPNEYRKSYKIEIEGATGTPTYSTSDVNYIEVSKDGVITPKVKTWYCKGNMCSTSVIEGYTSSYQSYSFKNDIAVNVSVDGTKLVQKVNLKNYAIKYSEDIMNNYLKENIKDEMTDYEKARLIAKFVASYPYSTSSSSYTTFFINGGGDCIASSDIIVYMTNKIGIQSHIRYAVRDAGAGNNHHNVAAILDGELYIIEAGYSGNAPRPYNVTITNNGLSYSSYKGFYQYDGYDEILNIPALKNTDDSLKDLSIDELILYVGKHNKTKVHTVNIPSSVVSIKGGAFSGVDTLKNINIDENNKNYVSMDNVVYTKDKKTLVTYPAGKNDATYNILNGVEKIDRLAFTYVKNLKHITIPDTVTNIDFRAFMYSSLVDIDIPISVIEIGEDAFYGSSKLESITINNKSTKIGTDAIPKSTTIMGYKGSTAEEYATNNGNVFVEITNAKIITREMISGIVEEIDYDGINKLNISIKDGDYILKEGIDYTLEYTNNTKPGNAKLIINGIGNYNGYFAISYKINAKKITYEIKSTTIEYGIVKLDITTNVLGVKPSVYYGKVDNPNFLSSSIPYRDIGDYKMIIEISAPNYETIREIIDLKIVATDINNLNLSFSNSNMEYSGKELEKNIRIYNQNIGINLVQSTDFKVEYKNNKNIGTASVIITGIGNYIGTITKEFEIVSKNISSLNISGIVNKNYTGSSITQNIKIIYGDIELKENEDYKIVYSNNTEVGIASMIITGIGNYTGSITKTFNINHPTIENCTISDITTQSYTGKNITPSVKIKDNGKLLVINKDYKVSYKNNKNLGTATVTITGMGDYFGSVIKTFKIVIGVPKSIKVKSQSSSSIGISWSKPSGTITGYQVYYSTNKDTGYKKLTTITKNATLSYTKTKLSSNKVYYFKVRAYKTVNKKNYYSSFSPVLAATTATSTPSVKLSGSKNSVTISWGKVSGATSYEIYQSTDNKTFIKLTNTTNNSYVSTNLNSATTYYYKVRAIKTYNNLNIKSSYSKTTSTTTKPDQVVTNGFSSTSSSITIKWNKVVRASGYDIYQSTDNKKFTKIARVSKGTTTSYKKTKLSSNKVYYYKVRAYKVVSKKYYYGSYSDVIATTTATKTPSIKVSSGNKTATISWSKVSGATSYDVYQSIDNKTFIKLTNTTSTSYVAENLNSATTYYYKVRAVKTYNDLNIKSSYSKLVGGTTKPDVPVVKLAPTKNSIKINWNKVLRVNGYEIYQSTDNKKYTKVATITKGSTTSYNKTKLKSNKTYFYKVRAYKTINGKKYYGSWSTIKNIKVK